MAQVRLPEIRSRTPPRGEGGVGLGAESPIGDRSRMTRCGNGMGLGPESDTTKPRDGSAALPCDSQGGA